jgi:diguanylate cyclase (GGDEF)-like protein
MPLTSAPHLRDFPAARTLELGFRRLVFPDALEAEFRDAHLAGARSRVRLAVFVALTTTLGFAVIDHFVLRANRNGIPDLVRFGLHLPIVLTILFATSARFYQRWYLPAIQIGAPLFGLGTVAMAAYAAPAYVSLIGARLLLVVFFFYFLLGLRFFVALRCNAIVFVGYALVTLAGRIDAGVGVYTLWTLICANFIGAAGAYALEYANRLAFLERRLLTDVAAHDGLTGLLNRRAFDEKVRQLWADACSSLLPLSVIMIDLDHFKAYNDRYGHPAGDECLRKAAVAMRGVLAQSPRDIIARYGGEEFIAVLLDAGPAKAEAAAQAALNAISALAIPHEASATRPFVSVSIGAASCEPNREVSHEATMQLADRALYTAKEQGRNTCVCFAA